MVVKNINFGAANILMRFENLFFSDLALKMRFSLSIFIDLAGSISQEEGCGLDKAQTYEDLVRQYVDKAVSTRPVIRPRDGPHQKGERVGGEDKAKVEEWGKRGSAVSAPSGTSNG